MPTTRLLAFYASAGDLHSGPLTLPTEPPPGPQKTSNKEVLFFPLTQSPWESKVVVENMGEGGIKQTPKPKGPIGHS